MLRALGLPEAAPIGGPLVKGANAARARTDEFFRMLAQAAGVAPPPRPLATSGGERVSAALRAAVPSPSPAPLERGRGGEATFHQMIAAAARQEKIPPALLSAVVEVESSFQPGAVSKAGALGLTQLMPGTARALGVSDPFDPWQNLVGGARFLRGLIDRYPGNLSLAVAAYNAGPGAVDAAGGQIPPFAETRAYVRLVLGAFQRNVNQDPAGGTA